MQSDTYASFALDSPGGDVIEALRISEIIKHYYISTIVPKNKNCISACFFLYLAGANRTAAGTLEGKRYADIAIGYVGLHRPYLSTPVNTDKSKKEQSSIMKSVRKYLENELVSNRLIDIMMSRPSNDIYWMTEEDIEEIGNYSPAQEELYITKCNYNRKTIKQYTLAKYNKNEELSTILLQQISKTVKCIGKLDSDMYKINVEKTSLGWTPSNNPLKDM
jgi:hypothetical protein